MKAIKALGLNNTKDIDNFIHGNKEGVSDNDFIPIISLDKSYKDPKKKYGAVYRGSMGEKTILSKYLDNAVQPLEDVKITVPTEIRLNVRKGNSKANDNKGSITITSKGVIFNDEDNKYETGNLNSSTIIEDVKYNTSIKIKVSPLMIRKNSYIDFFANDNDWLFYSVSNVHCGRISISNTSRTGKQLTENIEKLPEASTSQKLPRDPYEKKFPEKSFEVANKYKNPGGMCYAVSMARVSKAFTNQKIYDAIKIATSGDDYIYSGTISNSIPDKHFGYGVGGALAKNGYAELINAQQVWEGKLEEGAMLQYWNDPDRKGWGEIKKAIKDSLNGINNPNFHAGHSVIFKGYIFDDEDNIVALWCYDYSGTQRRFEKDDIDHYKIFLGANLKDKK